jgi:RNA polymerase sigma-70 factor (ECF subfamily)
MAAIEIPQDVLDWTCKRAPKVVRKWCSRHGFPRKDSEDLAQELVMEVFARWPEYDPATEPLRAFIEKCYGRRLDKELRRRHAPEAEDRCSVPSLDAPIKFEDGEEVVRGRAAGQVDEYAPDRRTQLSHLNGQALAELRLDIATILEQLPPDLRELCELAPNHSPAELARRLGVKPDVLQERMARLQHALRRAGYQEAFSVLHGSGRAIVAREDGWARVPQQ